MPLKIFIVIIIIFLETNTSDVGGFLQVQHYWGVNICHKVLRKSSSMKITDDFHLELKPSRAYHKIDTFHGEQRHKGGPWYVSP